MNDISLSVWNFKEKRETAWTTENECRFIDKLGSLSNQAKLGRHRLLESYCEAINKRSDWGAMDQLTVRLHLGAAMKRIGCKGI